ncbi:MAG: hypothetical protein HYX37_14740 [Rhizobiales bacterium]|nr:hypothetical protein [Hyphomicrobiales bacterium]
MYYGAELWAALRQLLIVVQHESNMEAGRILKPAATINGCVNIGFGLPAMLLTAFTCWVVSGIVVLTLVGWSMGAYDVWAGGVPAGYPDCYLRTGFWTEVCAIASVFVGVCTGADIRWWIIKTDEPELTQFKNRLLPRVDWVLIAVLITSVLAFATASVYDLPQSFATKCASISVPHRF